MENNSVDPLIKAQVFTSTVIWYVFIVTVFIFIALPYIAIKSTATPREGTEVFFIVFLFLSVILIGLIFFFKKIISPEAYLKKHASFSRIQDQKQEAIEDNSKEVVANKAMYQIVKGNILSFVFSESIVIYGFVLSFLSKDPTKGLPLCILGLIVLLVNKPKSAEYYTKLKQDFILRN